MAIEERRGHDYGENRYSHPTLSEIARSPKEYFRRIGAGIKQNWHDNDRRFITGGLLVLSVLALLFLAYWISIVAGLPSVSQLRDARFAEASIVYSADGVELARYSDENRTWVSLDRISPNVVNALIATEDHRFYKHWGIDVQRTVGSFFKTLSGDVQGGSTITMQFARNAFPEMQDDFALTRKVKEWITALRLEAMYGKDEIVEMYLNTVPLLFNTFGVEAASMTYYGKHASELDVSEAATLVGMLKGTMLYNPVRNPERSHERRNTVLQQMVKHGFLQPAQFELLEDEPTRLNFRRTSHTDNAAPYFAEYLRLWIKDWTEKNGYNLYTDGLRIHTTIDAGLQAAADSAVRSVGEGLQAVADVEWSVRRTRLISSNTEAYRSRRENVEPFSYLWESNPDLLDRFVRQTERYRALADSLDEDRALAELKSDSAFVDSVKTAQQRVQAGLVSIDPSNGHVKVWVGGRNFEEDKYDRVAVARRQPGSTFKPFVYAAAIDRGYSPEDVLLDEVIEYVDRQTGKRWRPENTGRASGEPVSLRQALAQSMNTVTAQVVADVGPSSVVEIAHRAGIKSELDEVPSIGLGTSEVTLLELTAAYATFANGGVFNEPIFVTRIEDRDGNVLATFTSEPREALNPSVAYTVLDMMRGVVDYGTGVRIRSAFSIPGDIAGKTGTTQGGADGWFVLLHPDLVTGAWVGFNSMSVAFRSDYWGQGAHNALYVVGNYLQHAELQPARFNPPAGYRVPQPGRETILVADVDYENEPVQVDSLFGDVDADDDFVEWQDAEEMEDENPEDEQEVDELNRRARERSNVSDILRRMRERD